jgi:hypothetical protein
VLCGPASGIARRADDANPCAATTCKLPSANYAAILPNYADEGVRRIRSHAPVQRRTFNMSDNVFISEPVLQVVRLYEGLIDRSAWSRPVAEQLERLGCRLHEGHHAKLPGAAVELSNWLPRSAGRSAQDLFDDPLSLDDALEAVSRAHGFAGWRAASSNVEKGDPDFEGAVELLLSADLSGLEAALGAAPDLVGRRSHYGHRATLLHYLAANGVETYRQRVPRNAANIAALLLARGADRLAEADMYGGRQTTRSLLITSSHPAEAGVTDDVLKRLDSVGAA